MRLELEADCMALNLEQTTRGPRPNCMFQGKLLVETRFIDYHSLAGIAEIAFTYCVKDNKLVRYDCFRQDKCVIANKKMTVKIFRFLVDYLSTG